MTNVELGRWLLVTLAIVGLAFAAPVASAHGTDTTAEDTTANTTTAGEWATWMTGQMTEHMGPDSVAWMESHAADSAGEMGQNMADEEQHHAADDEYHGGIDGQSHC